MFFVLFIIINSFGHYNAYMTAIVLCICLQSLERLRIFIYDYLIFGISSFF